MVFYFNISNDTSSEIEENVTTIATLVPTKPDLMSMLSMELSSINLPCILVSPVIIALTMFMSEQVYRVVMTNVVPGQVRSCVLDCLLAGEATIVSWELLTMFHQYGETLWALGAWVTITVKLYKYKPEATPCPYSHVISFITGHISLKHLITRIIAQFTGGLIFYRCT